MKKLKGLIFDLEGTIINTMLLHLEALNCALQLHLEITPLNVATYTELTAFAGSYSTQKVLYHYSNKYQIALSKSQIETIVQTKRDVYIEAIQKTHLLPKAGIVRLIESAYLNGIKVAIATTSNSQTTQILLGKVFTPKTIRHFDVILTGDHIKHNKPHPEIYLKTLEALEMDATNCVAIEDSTEGLQATTKAHLATVVTPVKMPKSLHALKYAKLVVSHLGDPYLPSKVAHGTLHGTYVDLDTLDGLL